MSDAKEKDTIKDFLRKNIPWVLVLAFSVANLYLGSILSPLKEDLRVNAASSMVALDNIQVKLDGIQKDGTINSQINTVRIKAVEENIIEIKQTLVRIENKL
ncbi:MAG: hypothetical protein NUV65_05730 [Candidatus Roizmanbacteria bacterium]|nr:hypothetical protein [Candidatus Roizmanbacteria bacterium]